MPVPVVRDSDADCISAVEVPEKVTQLWQLENAKPVEARLIFRKGRFFKEGTRGLCRGFTQCNIAGIHGKYAKDFAEFCRVNSAPLPLLQCSPPGVFSAPDLAKDSDIRTDITGFREWRNGEHGEILNDLLGVGDALKNFAFAYIGCSFGFDKALLDAGVSLPYVDNPDVELSMYTTNISCNPVGPFGGLMAVSMRPVARDMLDVVFKTTLPLPDMHGAPVHIGNPVSLGIHDLQKVSYGGPPPPLTEDQVPVFWACGDTIKELIKYSKLPLSFTVYSDGMYIGDEPIGNLDIPGNVVPADTDVPVIVEIVSDPYWASVVSQPVLDKMQQLGQILENNMEISTILKDSTDRLLKTSLALSHSSTVALIASPSRGEHQDGISGDMMGAVALARLLLDLGKTVTLVVDPGSFPSMVKTKDALVEKGILKESITLLQHPPANTISSETAARNFLTEPDNITAKYDHLISLGSVQQTEGVHQLFIAAKEFNMTITTQSGPLTDPCGTPGDLYGYAIAIVLYWLRQCPIHDRYRRYGIGLPASEEDINKLRAALPSIKMEESVLKILAQNTNSTLPPNGDAVEAKRKRFAQLLGTLKE